MRNDENNMNSANVFNYGGGNGDNDDGGGAAPSSAGGDDFITFDSYEHLKLAFDKIEIDTIQCFISEQRKLKGWYILLKRMLTFS